MNNFSIEVKSWFYDKLNKEYGCNQIDSWLAICSENAIEKETERAFLTNWKKIDRTGDEPIVTPLLIWVPKSCVNVMEYARF